MCSSDLPAWPRGFHWRQPRNFGSSCIFRGRWQREQWCVIRLCLQRWWSQQEQQQPQDRQPPFLHQPQPPPTDEAAHATAPAALPRRKWSRRECLRDRRRDEYQRDATVFGAIRRGRGRRGSFFFFREFAVLGQQQPPRHSYAPKPPLQTQQVTTCGRLLRSNCFYFLNHVFTPLTCSSTACVSAPFCFSFLGDFIQRCAESSALGQRSSLQRSQILVD